jgi:hypothetical protein
MAEGNYVIYEVDSIVHDAPVNVLDTFRYFIKELNDSTYLNMENQWTKRIERSYKVDWDDPWQVKDIWTAVQTNTRAEKVEENIRYIKLAFPVTEAIEWDGNAANNLETWDYYYDQVDVPASVGDTVYQKTCKVIQRDRVNAIEREYAEEVFAYGVGLVYKRLDLLELESVVIGGEVVPSIVRGIEFEMRAIESGVE